MPDGTLHASAAQAIPYPAMARAGAVDAIAKYLAMQRDWGQTRKGYAGDGLGNVDISDRPHAVYVRLDRFDGDVVEARVLSLLDPQDNDIVLVRPERPGGLGGYLLLDWYGPGTPPLLVCEDCKVYYQSQTALEAGTGLPIGVAVREHYAYVVYERSGDMVLVTFDLSNPAAPSVVNDQTIQSPAGAQAGLSFGIAVLGDRLWVSNFNAVASPRTMYLFDISVRAAPTPTTSWNTRMDSTWVPFQNWDGSAFTGQPYLLGINWLDGGGDSFTEFVVENGLIGGEMGTLAGDYGKGSLGSADGSRPVVCGNIILVEMVDSTLRAIDLNNVTAPFTLWEDTGIYQPEVYLGSNRAYAQKDSQGESWLYTQVDVDATRVDVGAAFPGQSVEPWGYFLNGACLYRVGRGASRVASGEVWGVSTVASPTLDMSAAGPLTNIFVDDDAQFASADLDGDTLYLCQVGAKLLGVDQLTVFTNTP